MYFLSIGDSIVDAFRTVMYVLCELIYSLMVFFFKVFQALGRAQILDETITKTLFGRISLIIGIFMTFRLTFAFIQYIINPDTLADKKKGAGNIIVKIVVAVVLLGSSNYIFQFAYKVQDKIISSAIIEKIIFGVAQDTEDFGQNLSAETFTVFYRLNPDIDIDSDPGGTAGRCIAYVQENENQYGRNSSKLRDDIINANGNLGQTDIYKCLGERAKIKNSNDTAWVIQFDGGGIMAVLIGCAVSYLIIMFTIQVGVRIIQLAYLQIIAPIPIMMYITTSGEDKLKKYFDQCITTFLDFFIRTAIIYFAIYAIDMLNSGNVVENIFAVAKFGNNIFETGYIKIVMIIAILTFAKKVPNLLKEIFPSLGGAAGFDYGLNLKKTINDTIAPAIFGAGIGAVGGLASNAIHGYMNARKDFREKGKKAGFKSIGKGLLSTVGGAFGGAKAGLGTKDITKMGNAVKVANANREKRELMAKAGYRWYNSVPKRIGDSVLSFAGETSGAEAKLKTAQFRQEALQQSKALAWESFYKANPTADLGLLRSIQEFEEKGKKVYKGIDKTGNELTFTKNAAGDYINTDAAGRNILGVEAATVSDSLDKDKQIKDQGKIIKGLQTADEKSKK